MIHRIQSVKNSITPGRILIVYGPRRVGKTTLIRAYFDSLSTSKKIFAVGDDIFLQELFGSLDQKRILAWAENYDVITIDEAQYIPHIGNAAKILIDTYKEKTIILTGSSSFTIKQNAGEPLTGRHFELLLLPISQAEIKLPHEAKKRNLEDYLLYGSYPEILTTESAQTKKKILHELVNSYILKDVLVLDKIKSPQLLVDILRALAFQIGNEVSFSEIAKTVGRDIKTVQRYIDILEKTFIIKRLGGYTKNLRTEIARKSKFYFYDLGIRNMIINQFNPLAQRDDTGALWENFIFMELYKKSVHTEDFANFYFWKTHTGKEVDIIKELNGTLTGFECKFTKKESGSYRDFMAAYPNSVFHVVNKENYLDIIEKDIADTLVY